MNRKAFFVTACAAVVGAAAVVGSIALAETGEDAAPAAAVKPKLPPGWTEADMKACMDAATPGKMHEQLTKRAGTWEGKTTMWMGPGADPVKSDTTATITTIMDGRFIKCDIAGEMPNMGKFTGMGINGFDNVSQKLTATWIDSFSTAIMQGTGEISTDEKTFTWTYNYTCPITKKPTTMRQIEKMTGENTMSLEMFGIDPKSGKEFKMMVIDYTKKQ